jgi:formate-dependent nitrite reductase cytochrome c552 subunit
MEIPTLDARPLELESVLDSDCVAIGFSKSDVGEITFPIATSLVRKIESKFQLNLQDELSFFATTGKVGEIFEIPVSAPGLKCQRLICWAGKADSLRYAGKRGSSWAQSPRNVPFSI